MNHNESTKEQQHEDFTTEDDECESAQCTKVSVPNIQCQFQSFNSALQDEVQRIEAKRQEVESQEKALNEERQRMMQILVKDDDVISLNIGGKNMAASRSTLCQVEGSLIASMFSGRWEDRLKKDKQGNVFLDFNPDCFKLILNYLRAKKIETPRSQAKKPKPPEEERSNYWNLVEYLGLREELQSGRRKSYSEDSVSNNRAYDNLLKEENCKPTYYAKKLDDWGDSATTELGKCSRAKKTRDGRY